MRDVTRKSKDFQAKEMINFEPFDLPKGSGWINEQTRLMCSVPTVALTSIRSGCGLAAFMPSDHSTSPSLASHDVTRLTNFQDVNSTFLPPKPKKWRRH